MMRNIRLFGDAEENLRDAIYGAMWSQLDDIVDSTIERLG